MGRNIESDYKNYISQNTPDLWNRIEEGLEPKKAPAEEALPEKRSCLRIKRKTVVFAEFAAAAACICLVIFAVSVIGPRKGSSAPSQSAAAEVEYQEESAMNESALPSASMEEAAAEEYEADQAAAPSAAMEDAQESAAENNAGGTEAAVLDETAEAEVPAAAEEDQAESSAAVTDENEAAGPAQAKDSEAAGSEAVILRDIKVEIPEISSTATPGSTITAVVVSDSSGAFKEGDVIRITADGSSIASLPSKAGTYIMDLYPAKDAGSDVYTIISYKQ